MLEISLYVHVPFCRAKCPYCDFYSGAAEALGVATADYFAALAREFELQLAARPALRGRELRSLYFGGGTPGAVEPERYASLLSDVFAAFSRAPRTEITLEVNPGVTDAASLARFAELGVNRFSVGVQSFQDRLLAILGRIHDAAAARQTLEWLARMARAESSETPAANAPDFGIDLIFGAPTQTLEEWAADLDAAVAGRPAHISLYGLTFHEGAPFFERRKRGELAEADEDLQAEMYELARRTLSAAGYEHYEISNFARPGRRSRHNTVYWDGGEYLGLGAAAHSFLGGARYHNPPDAAAYVQTVRAGRLAAEGEEPLGERSRLGEAMMLGLRLIEGIDVEAFIRRFEVDIERYYAPELKQLIGGGLLERRAGRLRLTDRGLLLADRVMTEFF